MRILCLLSLFLADTSALHISKQTSSSVALAQSKNAEAAAKPVFYVIVMGKLSFRHQVSLWLSSLRKLGGYTDEVVLVTDRPDCLAKTLIEANLLGDKLKSDEHADVYAPAEGYVGNIHMLKRPGGKHRYDMKMEKSRAWTNVQNAGIPHPVSSIIYTDEDIVIGKDLTSFISFVRETEKAKHTLALFRDTGRSFGELHTGVVVIFPGSHTEECLARWGVLLVRKAKQALRIGHRDFKEAINEEDLKEDMLTDEELASEGPDQQALAAAHQCKAKGNDHDGIKILPKEWFWFPTAPGLHKQKIAEFIHFTNTGRWKTISHSTIRQYLLDIGVPAHIDPMGHVADKTCADDTVPNLED